MVATFQAKRRIKLAPSTWREPGELLPEAHIWFRPEAWVHTGFLKAVDVEDEDFEQALGEYLDDDTAEKVRASAYNQRSTHREPRPQWEAPRKQPGPARSETKVKSRRKVEEKSDG